MHRIRKAELGAAAFALVALAPSTAADEVKKGFTPSGSAAITSDYRFRGVSHSDRRAAVQGSIQVAHASGLYAGVWGSSMDADTPVNGGADAEINFYGGYNRKIDALTLGGGWHYYVYPDHDSGPYARQYANIMEGFVSAAYDFGPVTASAELDYAPKQKSLATSLEPGEPKQDNVYIQGSVSGAIPGTPIMLSGLVGHTFGPSYLTYTEDNYTNWQVTAAYTWKMLTLSVSYVDTNIPNGAVRSNGSNRDLASAGVVGAITVAF